MRKLIFAILLLAATSVYAQKTSTYGDISAASAACATTGSCVTLSVPPDASSASFVVEGTYSGTLQFEGLANGATYSSIYAYPTVVGAGVSSTTSTGTWQANVAGLTKIRVRCSSYTSGTAKIGVISTTGAFVGVSSSNTSSVKILDGSDAQMGISSNPLFNATSANATAPGADICYITSAASTNATNCKASAGNVYLVRGTNTTSTAYYLRMYNLATAPTCSSATGFVETIPLLPTDVNGASMAVGRAYSVGIGFCLTGGGGSTDNTNAATGIYITIGYK